jgi:uncharacterized protein with HEPN domain
VKDDRVYLDHIAECIEWVTRHAESGREAFFSDRKTQSAVLRELQTLAESTQRVSAAAKQRHPEIPWDDIAGLRNVLVHGYLGIQLDRIWRIVECDLPPLQAAVEVMRTEDGSNAQREEGK